MSQEDLNPPILVEPDYILAIKVTAGLTSILSISGASLIIFTYIAFRKLRTKARQLLVSISIADIIVAGSHFVGLFVNFERFVYNGTSNISNSDPLCVSQAAFSMFGTLASFLLTLAIGVYLTGLLITKKPGVWQKSIPVIYIVCWGIPATMIIPIAVKKYYGFTLGANIGWCYIYRGDSDNHVNINNVLAEYFSYEIWVWLVFIALPILYITTFIYIRCKRRRGKYQPLAAPNLSHTSDFKLLLVPIILLLLRIWNTVLDTTIFNKSDEHDIRSQWVAAFVIIAGVGDNAQGIANALLFCVFTKQVREQLLSKQSYKSMCTWGYYPDQLTSAVDENTSFKNDRQFYADSSLSYDPCVQSLASPRNTVVSSGD